MPGAFMSVQFFPRHRYDFGGRVVYAPAGWGAMKGLVALPREPADGIYAVESVPTQNFFDYGVYSRPGPIALLAVGFTWHREAFRVVDHPIFYELLVYMYGGPSILASNYHLGSSQVELLGRNIAGPVSGMAYIMMDYSGAVDAWVRLDTVMPLGDYQHFRLPYIYQPADWYKVTAPIYIGRVWGAPDPHSRM